MRNVFVASLFVLAGFVQPSFAGHEHSAEVCSAQAPEACLHLGFHSEINTTDAATIMVHFTSAAAVLSNISNVAVDLWMPDMGHGSSPVTLTQKSAAFYQVTNAYFLMEGAWLVRVNFNYNGAPATIEVPVEVK